MLSLWQAEAHARQRRSDAGPKARRKRLRWLPEDSGLSSNRTFLAGPRAPNMLRAAQSTPQRGVRGLPEPASETPTGARRETTGSLRFVPFACSCARVPGRLAPELALHARARWRGARRDRRTRRGRRAVSAQAQARPGVSSNARLLAAGGCCALKRPHVAWMNAATALDAALCTYWVAAATLCCAALSAPPNRRAIRFASHACSVSCGQLTRPRTLLAAAAACEHC